MVLYEGATTRVNVDPELSEEFEIIVGMHQGSVLSPFCVALVVDVVIEITREGALSELLYANNLVLMSEIILGLSGMFLEWKEAFESISFEVNLGMTKVMVSSGITLVGLSKSNVDPCGVCCMRVMANSVLCEQCGMWIHGRCAGVKSVTPEFSTKFYMLKM